MMKKMIAGSWPRWPSPARPPTWVLRTADKDIVDTAVAARSFTTLVNALQAADLVETLKGAGPLHGVCADRRGVRQAARRNARGAAEAREQAQAGSAFSHLTSSPGK